MEDKVYSNAVVTFSRQQMLAPVPADNNDEVDEETYGKEYLKAVEGSFDERYFKDPVTGLFCQPNYNKDWKGLVKIRDITRYRESDFAHARRDEKKKYTIDDFERNFPFICFEVQEFKEFLGKLPAPCFNKGITKDSVMELFEYYEDFLNGKASEEGSFDFFDNMQAAVDLGLLEKVDTSSLTDAALWAELAPSALREICTDNGLAPARTSAVMIKRLVAGNIKFPYQVLKPADLLKQCYEQFIDLYIDQVKVNADHFHPLYFKDLWDDVERANYHIENLEGKVKEILKNPYWGDRLCKAVKFELPWEI